MGFRIWQESYYKKPKGEPLSQQYVKDEPPLNRIMLVQKQDGIPNHILNMRSGGGCAATKKRVTAEKELCL